MPMKVQIADEHKLAELLHDLDAVGTIIANICDFGPRGLPYDDLNWAVSVIDAAANFIQQQIQDGEEHD
jgi:hypothetical protein